MLNLNYETFAAVIFVQPVNIMVPVKGSYLKIAGLQEFFQGSESQYKISLKGSTPENLIEGSRFHYAFLALKKIQQFLFIKAV